MNLSFKLFFEDQGRYVFGPGRVELLRAVDELGSLRKAAQKLGMSYRWAWGRLRDAEKALGIDLFEGGGHNTRGTPRTLTAEGRELLAWYEAIEKDVAAVLDAAVAETPGFLQKSDSGKRSP